MVGRTIAGKFLIQEMVGEGAMGSIYRAEQTSLGKTVCIKVLHRHLSGDKTLSKRFHREARAASRLKHPNAITIIDFGTAEDGTHYIAMDFIDGRDLAQLLKKEFPLDPKRILHFVDQICAALDDSHAQGIIHRDLKPENIMVEDRRHQKDFVTVLDFGIAKIKDPDSPETFHTMAGIVCGTPEYMSPEQARGESLDARSDIYSLGVIVYQLATGKLPFTADTPIGVVTKHLTQEPAKPRTVNPDIHPAMEQFILRLMSKDREGRPPTCMDVKNLLGDLLEALDRDPDALAQTAPMLRPSDEELVEAGESQEPELATGTSPYAPAAEEVEADDYLKAGVGMGTGTKVTLWVVLLAVLGVGGYFLYDKVISRILVSSSGTEEQAAVEGSEKGTGKTAREAAEAEAEIVRKAREAAEAEAEEARKAREAAEAETKRLAEEEKKKFARVSALSLTLQKHQLSYASNMRMLEMRLDDWKQRNNEVKVKAIEDTMVDCVEGKKRVMELLESVKKGELETVELQMGMENERVDLLKKNAELFLSEELPAMSGQEGLAAARVQELTHQLTESRKELAGFGGRLEEKKAEWAKTPNRKKGKEIDSLMEEVSLLDKEYETIFSGLSEQNVGTVSVEYGRSLGKRDVLQPKVEAIMAENVGPTTEELKEKAEAEKKRLEEKRKKDGEARKKAEAAALKKAEADKKKAEEAAKSNKSARRKKAKDLTAKGDAAVQNGQYAKAKMFYKQALKQWGSAKLYKKLGKTYNSMGENANGAKYLRKYLKAMEGKLSPSQVKMIERQIRD